MEDGWVVDEWEGRWRVGWVDGWTDSLPPVFLSLGGVMQASVAGGPARSPGERSGDSNEQTDEDGELDTAAQAQPLGSKVSLPAATPSAPHSWRSLIL